jgi:hypothetical protein
MAPNRRGTALLRWQLPSEDTITKVEMVFRPWIGPDSPLFDNPERVDFFAGSTGLVEELPMDTGGVSFRLTHIREGGTGPTSYYVLSAAPETYVTEIRPTAPVTVDASDAQHPIIGLDPDFIAAALSGGGGTGGPVAYHHEQLTAATNWTVNHNLGFKPSGAVARDSTDRFIVGVLEHVDVMTLIYHFAAATGGSLDLS